MKNREGENNPFYGKHHNAASRAKISASRKGKEMTSLFCRFMSRVQDLPNGCWQWIAAKNSEGYGQFRYKGRQQPAHRISYEWIIGPIPEKLTLDHLCRNRACVNPYHMEPISSKENVLRGSGITANNALKTHCINGHPFDLFNTRIRPDGHRSCHICRLNILHRWRKNNKLPLQELPNA